MTEKTSFKVTYLGGPTAILEIGGLRIMTDPTLDPPGVYHSGVLVHEKLRGPANVDIGKIDIVLLSHDQHFDNLDHGGRELLQKVSKSYSTMAAAARMQGTMIGLTTWQTEAVKAPDGTEILITSTPARHGPAAIEALQGDVTGFLLTVKGAHDLEIYITGDTTYYEGVAEVARRHHPQFVFLFAGAAQVRGPFNVTMGTNDAMDTAIAFPNATIIPLHYEGWKHYTQNEKDIKKSYEVLGIDQRLRILEAGVPVTFEI
jgi:L-ascorbate metabolism protein UlaG (beta-lactamase superfamily)